MTNEFDEANLLRELKRLKSELKLFEKSFEKDHQSKPNVNDIKLNETIRAKYKEYEALKKKQKLFLRRSPRKQIFHSPASNSVADSSAKLLDVTVIATTPVKRGKRLFASPLATKKRPTLSPENISSFGSNGNLNLAPRRSPRKGNLMHLFGANSSSNDFVIHQALSPNKRRMSELIFVARNDDVVLPQSLQAHRFSTASSSFLKRHSNDNSENGNIEMFNGNHLENTVDPLVSSSLHDVVTSLQPDTSTKEAEIKKKKKRIYSRKLIKGRRNFGRGIPSINAKPRHSSKPLYKTEEFMDLEQNGHTQGTTKDVPQQEADIDAFVLDYLRHEDTENVPTDTHSTSLRPSVAAHDMFRSSTKEHLISIHPRFLSPHISTDAPIQVDLDIALSSLTGFSSFRPGQREIITSVLSAQPTLAILPTGAGKSLCYQLPTFILRQLGCRCFTLIICPLISLMHDQLLHLPKGLSGACLSGHVTKQEMEDIVTAVAEGDLQCLFISPERLLSESFIQLLRSPRLPPIAFACIDEAHCVTEWSHHFRVAYLSLGHILTHSLKVTVNLAMSATITRSAESSLCQLFHMTHQNVYRGDVLRDNLYLSVSHETDKLKSLVAVFKKSPFKEIHSLIVYCMKQHEADDVAFYLQQHDVQAESYHAGKSVSERRRLHDKFMNNQLRVMVATVAFGMGVHKQDIRGILHFHMPRSLEHYLQEIGRAGRDHLPAYCHLFLDEADYRQLRSLAFTDGLDQITVKQLLENVVQSANGSSTANDTQSLSVNPSFHAVLPMVALEQQLDIRKEVIHTLLAMMSLYSNHRWRLLNPVHQTLRLTLYRRGGVAWAVFLQDVPFLKRLLETSKTTPTNGTSFTVLIDTLTACQAMEVTESMLKRELYQLQFQRKLQVTFLNESFHLFGQRQDLQDKHQLQMVQSKMIAECDRIENEKVFRLDKLYELLMASCRQGGQDLNGLLKKELDLYFTEPFNTGLNGVGRDVDERRWIECKRDAMLFLRDHRESVQTGRQLARIFHGISSPRFSRFDWQRTPYWGKYMDVDFLMLRQMGRELLTELFMENIPTVK